jgi:hypothetical protein
MPWNPKAMNAKCNCNQCSGHIEFDDTQAGATVPCPHCGMDTRLYIPPIAAPPSVPRQQRPFNKKRLLLWFGLAAAVAILSAVGYLTYKYTETVAHGALGILGAIVVIAVSIVVFVWAVLWILFPVFVYFQLQEMNQHLARIEMNTRTVAPSSGLAGFDKMAI